MDAFKNSIWGKAVTWTGQFGKMIIVKSVYRQTDKETGQSWKIIVALSVATKHRKERINPRERLLLKSVYHQIDKVTG